MVQEVLGQKTKSELKRRTGFRWVILSLIFIVYTFAGADKANIGVIVPFIKDSFKLSNTDIGAMTSLFYIGYAIIQIPAGFTYGKKGVRKLLSLSILLTSIATLFNGLASSALSLKAARVILGFSEGPISIGIVTTINRWFPPQEKGLATGVFTAAVKFAPAIVPPACAAIILMFGWRAVFYVCAIPGIVIAFLWLWLVKDNPKDSPYCTQEEVEYINSTKSTIHNHSEVEGSKKHSSRWLDKLIRTKEIQPLDTYQKVTKSWDVWGCALGYFFMVGITYAIMTWVPSYLVTVKKFSVMKMGFVASAPWIGAMIGNIIGGWLSDKVFDKRRKPVMIITAAATVIMMYSLLYAPNNPVILGAVLLLAGILLNLGYSTFLVYPMGLASKEKCPYAASIVNTAGSLGGAFAPFIVGLILDLYNWNIVFTFLSACSLATLLILFTMIEPIIKNQE
jgi:MFS transporter, ACS family, glucarate transporter